MSKFVFLSGHAETVSKYLEALKLHRPTRSPPAGAIFIDFYKERNQIFVDMLFRNSKDNFVPLAIPG